MGSEFGGPVRVTGGLRRGARGDRWTPGFHATRASYVPDILERGLRLSGANVGTMSTPAGQTPWPNVAYGCHPVFVFLAPTHRDNYSWHTLDGETEKPVWLEVDLRGLTLYADFWELHELTEAAVSEAGFWWGNLAPDRERAPSRLKPYLDQAGVVTYEVLLDEAAGAAIETTRSAAIFAPVDPARIKAV